MALSQYQIKILRLLSTRRKKEGISYIAGGSALNHVLNAPRVSRDIDMFHDTTAALAETWKRDRQCLEAAGYDVNVLREAPSFVEARIHDACDEITMQWVRDSAFRFFPVIEDDLLGLALHPFDLATNKILALAGRLEPRDWIDTIECHKKLQPLGLLIWAACGKDPGINPGMLLNDASRMHYAQKEIDILDFVDNPPSAEQLSRQWKDAVASAKEYIDALPEDHVGECVANATGELFRGSIDQLVDCLQKGSIIFHKGAIGGAWPQISG